MKRLIICLMALCCVLPFMGCDKENDLEYETNIIRLSDEHSSKRFFDGDDVAFYYQCQFETNVEFEIKAEDEVTLLQHDTATLTPGEGTLKFKIDTDGYEGMAMLCLTYSGSKSDRSKNIKTVCWDVTITTHGSWYYENEAINELLASCKDVDAETFAETLEGEYEQYSYLKYNDDWSKIIEPYLVIGYDYVDGLAYEKYNFNADGTGWHSVNPTEPDMETMTYYFNWSYDAESDQLTLSGEYNHKWRVTGCNDNYIVLDETTTNGDNLRTILRRSLL